VAALLGGESARLSDDELDRLAGLIGSLALVEEFFTRAFEFYDWTLALLCDTNDYLQIVHSEIGEWARAAEVASTCAACFDERLR
jgi:hypothetical protein